MASPWEAFEKHPNLVEPAAVFPENQIRIRIFWLSQHKAGHFAEKTMGR